MKRIIESIKFEDVQLQKAYSDYMYTRDMTDCDEAPGADDLALVALRYLKQHGKLDKLGQLAEDGRNAIKINVQTGGENEAWLLTFDCAAGDNALKGCITDALSGKAYPYAVMRVSVSGDPLEKTKGLVPTDGKLSQREIVTTAASRFAETAQGLGVAVGVAEELYHPGFAGGIMESAAVISAMPAVNIREDDEADDDLCVKLADEDICDEAEGRADVGAEYLRKIRSLFGNGEAARMIKDCCVCPDGLLCCVVGAEHIEMFTELAAAEMLECRPAEGEACDDKTEAEAAEATETAEAAQAVEGVSLHVNKAGDWQDSYLSDESMGFSDAMRRIAEDLNTCSGRGLSERFDSTIGSGAVMMPLGGANQLSPMQAAVYKMPLQHGETDDCTISSWGYNPYIAEASPYHGGYLAVVESIAKLVATGASFNEVYISLQRGFADVGSDGAEIAALLGAFEAEMGLGVPSIANHKAEQEFPALISYAITMGRASELISPDFKGAGHKVVMLRPEIEGDSASAYYGLPTPASLIALWRKAYELIANGKALAASTPTMGGVAESIMKMCYGGGIGFEFAEEGFDWSDASASVQSIKGLTGYSYGSIILEMASDEPIKSRSVDFAEIGRTTSSQEIKKGAESIGIGELLMLYEGKLESVYPANADSGLGEVGNFGYAARSWHTPIYKRQTPKALIPIVSCCTDAEDLARAIRDAGAAAEILMLDAGSEDEIRQAGDKLAEALGRSQILMLPGATNSALMCAIMKEAASRDAIGEFLNRKDGLVLGIDGGFKTLLELGLLPYGYITDEDAEKPELIINTLGAHQSRIARVCVASNKSPWLRSNKPGEIFSLPISTAAGRFTASDELIKKLAINGQIATQYVDAEGRASTDIRFNPCGSFMSIEGICSEDGRILGRVCRVERAADGLYRNVPGNYLSGMFENAVRYFK